MQEELDGAVRNKVVFQDIAKKLQEQGYMRDWEQCRTKVKNLKKEYRTVKDNNGETGRGRKTCKFYRELDSILGHRPASVPASLLDTGNGNASSNSADEEGTGLTGEANANGKSMLWPICLTWICVSQKEMRFRHDHRYWSIQLQKEES